MLQLIIITEYSNTFRGIRNVRVRGQGQVAILQKVVSVGLIKKVASKLEMKEVR